MSAPTFTPNCVCGARWTGKRMEHCTACHRTFSGTGTGDAHRYGPHGAGRKCMTVEQMTDKGWRGMPSGTGEVVWHFPETSRLWFADLADKQQEQP